MSKPSIGTKTLLENHRKEEILGDLHKLDKNYGSYKDVEARINDREKCHLRLGYKEQMGMTKGKIQEERKKQIIDNLTSKYGNVTVGIHGQELPKFNHHATTQEWWKHKKGFNTSPKF
jgi:hypothetical protein